MLILNQNGEYSKFHFDITNGVGTLNMNKYKLN
jgi:hypothetical protein